MFIDDKSIFIVMEYIEGINIKTFLNHVIETKGVEVADKYLLLILKDLVSALQFIHSRGVIHSDIGVNNIVIDKDLTPKLIDFGISCIKKQDCDKDQDDHGCDGSWYDDFRIGWW